MSTRGQGFGNAAASNPRPDKSGATVAPSIENASPEDRSAFAIAARKAMQAEGGIDFSSLGSTAGALRITDSMPAADDSPAPAQVVAPQQTDATPEPPADVPGDGAASGDPEPTDQGTENSSQEQASDPSADMVMRVLTEFSKRTVEPLKDDLARSEAARTAAETQSQQAAAQMQSLQVQLTEAQKSLSTFGDLQKLLGRGQSQEQAGNSQMGAPNVMTLSQPGGGRMIGAAAEFEQELSSSQVQGFNSGTQSYETLRDDARANAFVKSHRVEIMRDLEKSMKSAGLLRGTAGRATPETSAPTTMFDVIGGFLPVLSAIMRQNNRSGKIWHQFPTTRINFAEGQGGNVQVPRVAFQPAPANPNERLLSGSGIYQGIVNENQAIQSGIVDVRIQEWGLGGIVNAPPIGIPTFVERYSLIDLTEMLRRNLWEDYVVWEDMKARSLYTPTSRVVYNKKNRVTTDQTTIAAGDGGVATVEFAEALSDYAKSLLIPTLPDGCYIWAIPTRYLTSLRESLDGDLLAPSEEDAIIVKDYLSNSTGGMVDKISGYKGKIGNVHIFEGNSWGIGAAGTDGVQSETINGGPKLTRSGYFFGADTTGRGVGQEFNIRLQDDKVHFNRLTRAIWIEYSGWVALDVDPVGYADASPVPQQLRVIETRMLDVAQ